MQEGVWYSTGMKKAQNFVESYFQWCNREVAVVHQEQNSENLRVNLVERNVIWWHTLLKVISFATLIIPTILFITRAFLRLRCTLIVNFETRNTPQFQEYGRRDPLYPHLLCEGTRHHPNQMVETFKSRNYLSWEGSRKYPNEDKDIGRFDHSTNELIEGTRIRGACVEYISSTPLLKNFSTVGFAKVWVSEDRYEMRAIQRSSLGSYEPYSGSVYEALVLSANNYYYPDDLTSALLPYLRDKDYFDPKTFFSFISTPDKEGALPAFKLREHELKQLIEYYIEECSTLDVARKDMSTREGHTGETLFSYYVNWSNRSIINLFLRYFYSSCIGQIEERAIQFFTVEIEPVFPFISKAEQEEYYFHSFKKQIENNGKPIDACLTRALEQEQTGSLPRYNLANLFNPIELNNGAKRIGLHCVPEPTLLKLCKLYQQGKVVFEQAGVTGTQFLTFVDPISKDNLLTLWAKKGSVEVLKALLSIDPGAIKQEPQIPYFSIAVDSGHKAAANLLLAEMEKQDIPLTPLEIWFKKLKEAQEPLQITAAEGAKLNREELTMLLRAARRVYEHPKLVTQIRWTYDIANNNCAVTIGNKALFLPIAIMRKILPFVGYSFVRVSSDFRIWTRGETTKEITHSILTRLLPEQVFNGIYPALSKLDSRFYRSYCERFYSYHHNPYVFFNQLEFIHDRFKARAEKEGEKDQILFAASKKLLSNLIKELPRQVDELGKRAVATVGKKKPGLRDSFVEDRLTEIEHYVNAPYDYYASKTKSGKEKESDVWLSYEGRIKRIEEALESHAKLQKALAAS